VKIDLTYEVALVTGGTKNIGRAISVGLAGCGAKVACCYAEDDTRAKITIDQVEAAGGTARSYKVDIAEPDQITKVVGSVRADLGDPTILVNNAALRPRKKIAEITPKDIDDVVAVNMRAPLLFAQALLPTMREKGWGRIVNMSGGDAYHGSLQRPHVTASKLGIVGLARALALETASWGVTVNVVVPGFIDTVRDHPEWYPDMELLRRSQVPRHSVGRMR
jgi:NAD(P)-dependent dehydrogenase (short-subunit alcohol dehydrogenase family)